MMSLELGLSYKIADGDDEDHAHDYDEGDEDYDDRKMQTNYAKLDLLEEELHCSGEFARILFLAALFSPLSVTTI